MAAAAHDLSGHARIQARILFALRSRPLTAVELAEYTGVLYRLIVAELAALVQAGRIERVGFRYRLMVEAEPPSAA